MGSTYMVWGCYFHICFQRFSQGLYIRTCGIRLHTSCILMAVPCRAGGKQVKFDGMKRMLLSMLMSFLMSSVMFGQQEVTKFLGIPVDGSKEEMIRKLKEKGFKEDPLIEDGLEGEFNGSQVKVSVATNNNKVCRIVVRNAFGQNASNIKVSYNRLCEQFRNNEKYAPLIGAISVYEIPEDENISYEMSVNDKRYQAAYCQMSPNDSIAVMQDIKPILQEKYTKELLNNPSKEIKEDIWKTIYLHMIDLRSKRVVWFTIMEFYGEYYIGIYYDNVYNQANGEDL